MAKKRNAAPKKDNPKNGTIGNTADIRAKMLRLWAKFDAGKMSASEARSHIGMARTVLDTLKVEIAAAHLNQRHFKPVDMQAPSNGQLVTVDPIPLQ